MKLMTNLSSASKKVGHYPRTATLHPTLSTQKKGEGGFQ